MQGKLDFNQSLEERIHFLKDLPLEVLEKVRQSITFTPGARELCRALKRLGFKLAVVSGGFTPFANYVKHELGLDYAFANNIEEDRPRSCLTGNLCGTIVNAARKVDLLETIAQAENIPIDQVIAVGDGANDLPMLNRAGMGVAFNAKPKVQEEVRHPCLCGIFLIYIGSMSCQ